MDGKVSLTIVFTTAIWALTVINVAGQEGRASNERVFGNGQLLERIREAASTIPGELPTSINFLKFAESRRKRADVIQGGSDAPFISARTAFQVLYPSGSIMIDAGMDETVHRFYGFGREEPFWPDKNAVVQAALRQASLIVITHEHGDHVAGVLRSEHRDELAPKTLLTNAQAQTLAVAPQLPEITLSAEESRDYLVVDYERYLPVAPGMVLIKAPGHTPGHQIVYCRLADRSEFLFIGDVGWLVDNVTELKLRPEATIERIGEDPKAIMSQLIWIKQLMHDHGIIVVPSHDDELLSRYGEERVLGTELSIR